MFAGLLGLPSGEFRPAVISRIVRNLEFTAMTTRSAAAIGSSLVSLVSAVVAALTHLSALAQCPTNVPHITGTWTVLPYQMPINPISTNLLPNGKVLIVAGSENDASNDSEGAESYRA